MNDEHIATYIYNQHMNCGIYEIYAIYETYGDRDNRNVAWYDIYDEDGECVNEGNPFYKMPTWKKVFDTYYVKRVN